MRYLYIFILLICAFKMNAQISLFKVSDKVSVFDDVNYLEINDSIDDGLILDDVFTVSILNNEIDTIYLQNRNNFIVKNSKDSVVNYISPFNYKSRNNKSLQFGQTIIFAAKDSSIKEDNGVFVLEKEKLDSFKCNSQQYLVEPIKYDEVLLFSNLCKVVKLYVELDYSFYRRSGGNIQEAIERYEFAFNQLKSLYEQEGINLELSEIKVWDVPDPYSDQSSDQSLFDFSAAMKNGFNGDFAMLIDGSTNRFGGLAWLNSLNGSDYYQTSYCNIASVASVFPVYNWFTSVMAHELGHNLGSPHTHSCDWPGGAIDGCYKVEGNCNRPAIPIKGTIMSYCHLQGGIDFTLGFGELPRNLILNNILKSKALDYCEDEVDTEVEDDLNIWQQIWKIIIEWWNE